MKRGGLIVLLRVCSLGLSFAGSMWLARSLGPEKLGLSGAFAAYVPILALLITLNIEPHIIRVFSRISDASRRETFAAEILTFRLCLVFVSIVPVLLLGGIEAGGYKLVSVIGLAMQVAAVSLSASWVLQAQDKALALQIIVCLQSTITFLVYLLIISETSVAGTELVIAGGAALVCNVTAWVVAFGRNNPLRFLKRLPTRPVLTEIKKSRWLIVTGFVAYVYGVSDFFIVSKICGAQEVGIYRMAVLVAGAAAALAVLVPQIYYSKLLSAYSLGPKELWRTQMKIASVAFYLAPILILLTFIVIPIVFPIVFGSEFQSGGFVSALLISAKIVIAVASIFVWGLWTQNDDIFFLKILGVIATLFLIAAISGTIRFGSVGAASSHFIAELAVLFAAIFRCRYLSSQSEKLRELTIK